MIFNFLVHVLAGFALVSAYRFGLRVGAKRERARQIVYFNTSGLIRRNVQ